MSPIVGYHATRRICRESIRADGLIPNCPTWGRPYGVYVFHDDFQHPTYNSHVRWTRHPRQDLWEAAYIGPVDFDQYVQNGFIFLGIVHHATLVASNK